MVRVRGSTWALGLDAIFFGSVTAWGAGKVWAAAVSATTVLMSMTIANGMKARMGLGASRGTKGKFSRGTAVDPLRANCMVLRFAQDDRGYWLCTDGRAFTLSRSCAGLPCSRFCRRR